MCRWLAYTGDSIPLDDVLVNPNHSLIDQSLMARDLYLPGPQWGTQFRDHMFPTNGDGFGIAWSGRGGRLWQYRQTTPAWDSQNLRHLAAQIESGCFLAHVRAAPGGLIAEQNTHPFVYDGWMLQHNGEINDFAQLKRDLVFDVAPELYPAILGYSDSETCFFLAQTYGLADDPVGALTTMIRRVEKARADHGVTAPFRATMCASDGERLVVLRWSSPDDTEATAPSLFHSFGPTTLHTKDGGDEQLPDNAQLVVSEPIELHWSRRTWHEIAPQTIGIFTPGVDAEFTAIEI